MVGFLSWSNFGEPFVLQSVRKTLVIILRLENLNYELKFNNLNGTAADRGSITNDQDKRVVGLISCRVLHWRQKVREEKVVQFQVPSNRF
jgi:hypothetical protein